LLEIEQKKCKEAKPSDFSVFFWGFGTLFKEIIYSDWPLESCAEER